MSDKRQRRQFSAQEKVAIVKRHVLEGTPVSDLCDEFHIHPTLFYQWQRQLFENAHLAFDNRHNGRKSKAVEDANVKKIEHLEAKLQRKNEVLAELMEEHTLLKKNLGEI